MQYTENEERAMLLKFWRQYGRYLLAAVIIGLGIGYGWRYHQSHRTQQSVTASGLYQQVIHQPLQQHLGAGAPAVLAAHSLLKQFPQSSYAALANLWLAKNAVLSQNWNQADLALQKIISGNYDITLQQIARLRAARVLLQQKKYKRALETLSVVKDKNYLAQIDLQKGDIYAAEKKWALALKNYKLAQNKFTTIDIQAPLLGQKITNVQLQLK